MLEIVVTSNLAANAAGGTVVTFDMVTTQDAATDGSESGAGYPPPLLQPVPVSTLRTPGVPFQPVPVSTLRTPGVPFQPVPVSLLRTTGVPFQPVPMSLLRTTGVPFQPVPVSLLRTPGVPFQPVPVSTLRTPGVPFQTHALKKPPHNGLLLGAHQLPSLEPPSQDLVPLLVPPTMRLALSLVQLMELPSKL